jgi:hypothetical protein
MYEVEPHRENPVIAHVSRAVAHLWLVSEGIDEARNSVLEFLNSERWESPVEKDGYLLTPERIDGLGVEELADYQTAQSKGIQAKFYYWHRSE